MGAKLRWIIEKRRVGARGVALGVCLGFVVAAPAAAQTPAGSAAPSADRRESIIIGGKQPPAPTFERCVEVEIGRESSLGCLNQQLKREEEAKPAPAPTKSEILLAEIRDLLKKDRAA